MVTAASPDVAKGALSLAADNSAECRRILNPTKDAAERVLIILEEPKEKWMREPSSTAVLSALLNLLPSRKMTQLGMLGDIAILRLVSRLMLLYIFPCQVSRCPEQHTLAFSFLPPPPGDVRFPGGPPSLEKMDLVKQNTNIVWPY